MARSPISARISPPPLNTPCPDAVAMAQASCGGQSAAPEVCTLELHAGLSRFMHTVQGNAQWSTDQKQSTIPTPHSHHYG